MEKVVLALFMCTSLWGHAQTSSGHWIDKMVEHFDDNKRGWIEESVKHQYSLKIKDGKYYITNEESDNSHWVYFPSVTVSNDTPFNISCNTQWISGVDDYAYGIGWGESGNDNYTVFYIESDGYYAVKQSFENEEEKIVDWRESSAINKHGINKLLIVSDGEKLTLFINAKKVEDLKYYGWSGKVFLTVSSKQKVAFDDVEVSVNPNVDVRPDKKTVPEPSSEDPLTGELLIGDVKINVNPIWKEIGTTDLYSKELIVDDFVFEMHGKSELSELSHPTFPLTDKGYTVESFTIEMKNTQEPNLMFGTTVSLWTNDYDITDDDARKKYTNEGSMKTTAGQDMTVYSFIWEKKMSVIGIVSMGNNSYLEAKLDYKITNSNATDTKHTFLTDDDKKVFLDFSEAILKTLQEVK